MGFKFVLRSFILVPVLAAASAIAQQSETTGTIEVIDRIVAAGRSWSGGVWPAAGEAVAGAAGDSLAGARTRKRAA